ncbi:hypothetical protein EIP91_006176 [Steccherinum ochraceum]|uniref:Uncharacterized protein n=1 Tax=Steccherinum ochraceum TaxID=92696 RepID=A0A4R0REH8_9APHY|nr:hypothetical protein EIP91_006176 [Steccherinum ochraceum]
MTCNCSRDILKESKKISDELEVSDVTHSVEGKGSFYVVQCLAQGIATEQIPSGHDLFQSLPDFIAKDDGSANMSPLNFASSVVILSHLSVSICIDLQRLATHMEAKLRGVAEIDQLQGLHKELEGFAKLYEHLIRALREYQTRVVPSNEPGAQTEGRSEEKHRFRSAIRVLLFAVVFLGPLMKKLRKRT